MKRLVKLSDDRLGNKMLYVLKEEYQGFGLYQRKSQRKNGIRGNRL